jgi:hypothetical protein
MGYLGYVYVESKSFEVRSNVRGGVRLEERSKGLSRSVIMAWPSIFWLLAAWDSLTPLEKTREKWRSFRFGSIVYVLLRRTNKFGNFLELSEYGENGRRSFVIIPEGEEGKGWIDCREQLSKLKQYHDKQKMGEPLTGGRAGKIVAGATGLIKGQREISTANTSLQGAHKSYAEVLQGKGQVLNLNPKQDSNFEFESQAIGKPLKDALSGDLEQAEKTTGEQVDILNFRDLLSDFKRDLIQCIESYMAGWTPPNAEANRARKGVSNGRPKLSMEKPKVQLTYFRKIKQRPKTRWQKVVRPSPPPEAGPGLLQASQGSQAERFLEKGESSRAGSKPDLAPSSPAGIQHSSSLLAVPSARDFVHHSSSPVSGSLHLSMEVAPGPPVRDVTASPSPSPAGILQDRVSPEIAQCSVPECDEELRPRIKEKGGSSPACGSDSPRLCHNVRADVVSGSLRPTGSLHVHNPRGVAPGDMCLPPQSPPAGSLVGAGEKPCSPDSSAHTLEDALLIRQESPTFPVSGSGFLTATECPHDLANSPTKGLDLQMGPGVDMGQSWGTLVGVPQVGGVGSESVSVFSRLGGNELSIVDELRPDISDMAFKPLNIIIPCAAIESEFPDWVIKCAERIHSRVGVSYVGQKWQFMALLTFLEKERLKEIQSLSASKRNREVKNLESSINYDFRGEGQSSRGKRKGRGSDVV